MPPAPLLKGIANGLMLERLPVASRPLVRVDGWPASDKQANFAFGAIALDRDVIYVELTWLFVAGRGPVCALTGSQAIAPSSEQASRQTRAVTQQLTSWPSIKANLRGS